MKKELNKKASHVGVVLSFVIFITFLIFLYTIAEPAISFQRDKEALLDYLEIKLMNQVSTNLTIATVIINSTDHSIVECINLLNLKEEVGVGSRLIIKNESENISRANFSETDNKDLIINRNSLDELFFKIYGSEDFEKLDETTIVPCTELGRDAEGYNIGLIRSNEYIFEEKAIKLISDYEKNYSKIKETLKIPAGSDFSFGLIYSNKTKISTTNENISTNIYVKEIPIQYVDKEANIKLGYIDIGVW